MITPIIDLARDLLAAARPTPERLRRRARRLENRAARLARRGRPHAHLVARADQLRKDADKLGDK